MPQPGTPSPLLRDDRLRGVCAYRQRHGGDEVVRLSAEPGRRDGSRGHGSPHYGGVEKPPAALARQPGASSSPGPSGDGTGKRSRGGDGTPSVGIFSVSRYRWAPQGARQPDTALNAPYGALGRYGRTPLRLAGKHVGEYPLALLLPVSTSRADGRQTADGSDQEGNGPQEPSQLGRSFKPDNCSARSAPAGTSKTISGPSRSSLCSPTGVNPKPSMVAREAALSDLIVARTVLTWGSAAARRSRQSSH